MGRKKYNFDDDDEFDDGWGQQSNESDEDYEERMNDWNDAIEYSNDQSLTRKLLCRT